ncbi:glycosyltransferase [Candidatus Magnetominusculus dajiuhuensis]|uniref:glycosyltransferase n=1 Tax=Candidatus Magnetominusculus dajiuhuensis TaxID=3137712 RepID=UPI003B427F1E
MPKRVLMAAAPVHPVPPLKGAAVEMWIYEVSKRLVGYEPHVVCLADEFYPDKEYKDGIFFHRIRFGRVYRRLFQKLTRLDPFSYNDRILRLIREISPEIVHMHNSIKRFTPLIKAVRDCGLSRTMLHVQNEFPVDEPLELDAFTGCSQYIMNHYAGKPIAAAHKFCIYNGVDLDRFRDFRDVPGLRDAIRGRFGIKKDDFVAIFVGRISPEKGVEHFIESASIINKNISKKLGVDGVKFFVVGEVQKGSGDRADYARRQMEMASGLPITFTDVFTPSRIHLIYLLGDVFVLPSNFDDPFPFVALEAMATGLPIVARRKGGLTDYIIDGVNGLFVDEANPATGIAQKIELLASDESLRTAIGKAGRQTIVERFSWDKIAQEVESAYNMVV